MTTLQKRIAIGRSHNADHMTIFLDHVTTFLKPCDQNLHTAKSNSQRPFYYSSNFDSKWNLVLALVNDFNLYHGKPCVFQE